MLLTKLKTRHWRENRYLKSKQELMSKPYSTTSAWAAVGSWAFKIIILGFFGLLILFPFYFMITQSLTSIQWQIKNEVLLFPKSFEGGKVFNWHNFTEAFDEGYAQAIIYTVSLTVVSILVRMFFSITLGYAFALNNWKGKSAFFGFFISLMIIPEIGLLTGQYTIVTALGWQTQNWLFITMVVPFAASIFFAWMYRNAFEAIPNSVKESSMLDGANGFVYFFKVAMPMVKSTTWTVAVLTAFASWNSYVWPSLLFNGVNTLWKPINLWVFETGKSKNAELQMVYRSIRMAGTILAILPMLIIYFILRKRIMNAIARNGNATKG
ncbi:carbohydrate ABC transporter permease [Metamycoplasma neophronis]|uniref:Carbohydrate ABC transporter permease n=1 Tax=Metamycoplasma neophronis TaxID=872983 RepID=A0ABY2Z0H1_9BACT|nr:carbohydrate ABC transporter permease [Metamycoplasma neophronis]TPR54647.1 carbohydrate ABC transporter permease [Metamycoplasma neophronis]